jgi:hypothetical protein
MIEKLVQMDTDRLAMAGRHDANILSLLTDFSNSLFDSVHTIEKARQEEEKAAAQARQEEEKAAAQASAKAIEAQIGEKKKKWIASNTCFECKKSADIVNPCVCFKEDGISGDGKLACDDCVDKTMAACCADCNTWLCKESCDDSYKCKACEEIYCLPCAEQEETLARDSCCNWYCSDCIGDNAAVACFSCEKVSCDDCDLHQSCEGECGKPVCSECARKLTCGNDVHLCGECDFDCADCDYCGGYYFTSRWK